MSVEMRNIARLADLEGVIQRGLNTFVEVGNALREIRGSRLYREQGYKTFEKYCRERWGWSRSYAHRQIEAANTAELLPIGNRPANEAQTRELTQLTKEDPETAKRVWGGASHDAAQNGESPTARHIRRVKLEVKQAEALRSQLPPATRTVVEESDPDDCALSRSPAQLRHLADIARKHGDNVAAETALRVAGGEYKMTFDAYPDVKAEEAGGESRIRKIVRAGAMEYVVELSDGTRETVVRKVLLQEGFKKCECCGGLGVARRDSKEGESA